MLFSEAILEIINPIQYIAHIKTAHSIVVFNTLGVLTDRFIMRARGISDITEKLVNKIIEIKALKYLARNMRVLPIGRLSMNDMVPLSTSPAIAAPAVARPKNSAIRGQTKLKCSTDTKPSIVVNRNCSILNASSNAFGYELNSSSNFAD